MTRVLKLYLEYLGTAVLGMLASLLVIWLSLAPTAAPQIAVFVLLACELVLFLRSRLKAFFPRNRSQEHIVAYITEIPDRDFTGRNPGRDLPYFGRIAAGRPIEALSGNDRVSVPGHLLSPHGDDHYVLRVVGESMIDEGIHDGDFVIVLRRDIAEAGDMVVALVGEDATLKRYYPEGDLVRLQPANSAMQPVRVPARDVRVQGVVVGLMRKF